MHRPTDYRGCHEWGLSDAYKRSDKLLIWQEKGHFAHLKMRLRKDMLSTTTEHRGNNPICT